MDPLRPSVSCFCGERGGRGVMLLKPKAIRFPASVKEASRIPHDVVCFSGGHLREGGILKKGNPEGQHQQNVERKWRER